MHIFVMQAHFNMSFNMHNFFAQHSNKALKALRLAR
jgi:hypothetical protein